MNKIPEGWEACNTKEANDACTIWDSCVQIYKDGIRAWIHTPNRTCIYSDDWEDLGIIPIRKVKPEPFEQVVTVYRFGKYDDQFRISLTVPREGKYRVVEVIE